MAAINENISIEDHSFQLKMIHRHVELLKGSMGISPTDKLWINLKLGFWQYFEWANFLIKHVFLFTHKKHKVDGHIIQTLHPWVVGSPLSPKISMFWFSIFVPVPGVWFISSIRRSEPTPKKKLCNWGYGGYWITRFWKIRPSTVRGAVVSRKADLRSCWPPCPVLSHMFPFSSSFCTLSHICLCSEFTFCIIRRCLTMIFKSSSSDNAIKVNEKAQRP